jgi:hypothetical protein
MKARILSEKVAVHSGSHDASPCIGELHAGDEITLGKTVSSEGRKWVGVALLDGRTGYVPASTEVLRVRTVALAQRSVGVQEAPIAGSRVKITLTKGERFAITGLLTRDGVKWLEVRSELGAVVGFAPAETRVRPIVGFYGKEDHVAFMVGVFTLGAFLAVPLLFGGMADLDYMASLPWSVASCAWFLVSFRRDGEISWPRAIPSALVLIIAAYAYNQSTGKPAFGPGGVVFFLVIVVCGYIGIIVSKLLPKRKGVKAAISDAMKPIGATQGGDKAAPVGQDYSASLGEIPDSELQGGRSLLETCPHCHTNVMFTTSRCPNCQRDRDAE